MSLLTRWNAFLCRHRNHKIEKNIDFTTFTEIRCLRCHLLLSQLPKEEKIPLRLQKDKSYMNGCYQKARFGSYKLAEMRMNRMRERPATLHAYHCRHCNHYHLGNSKPSSPIHA